MHVRTDLIALVVALVALVAAPVQAWQAGDDALTYTIAEEGFSLAAPEGWKRVQPKSSIVETEFAIPSEGEGLQPGRMTVMGAGGSVQANVDRWYGQFAQPDGSDTKSKATAKKIKLAGCDVTIVDISGTYKDAPAGPFAGGKAVDRPDYRMLAAIVETPDRGNYFLKFYGPGKTVAKHADGFRAMVEGLVPAGK
ncbi:MAG: hypothetical protein NT171_08075 [Planctomycetota bacterium]|nr:hypothetical protein [Planctomycetota bacterium]